MKKRLVVALAIFTVLNPLVIAQAQSDPTPKPSIKKELLPQDVTVPLAHIIQPSNNYSDDLKISVGIVQDPKLAGKFFDNKMWRKRFVPVYVTVENTGNYPIEVSTGNILLLEESTPSSKSNTSLAQLSSTKPNAQSAVSTSKSGATPSKKKKKALPPFIAPTAPGIVFNKSKHVQYGWKSNLGMLALTGATLGFAAPVTLPAMVVGNMHRGTNKKLSTNFQDQSLGRITVEPGDTENTWLFYRRERKKQTLLPKKIVFADIYVPSKEELSSLVIDLQPMKTDLPAVRRAIEESERKDLQIFHGKIVNETKEEFADEKMKDLEDLGSVEGGVKQK